MHLKLSKSCEYLWSYGQMKFVTTIFKDVSTTNKASSYVINPMT